MRLRALALAAALATLPGIGAADVTATRTVTHFDIAGRTAPEIRQSIRDNAPDVVGRFDAYTQWFINWTFNWSPSDAGCHMTRVDTKLKATIIFPRLTRSAATPPDLRRKWQAFADALLRHEQGHVDIATETANEIDARLSRFRIDGPCSSIEARANEAAMLIIRKGNRRDRDYDRDTRHGASQGAVFP